MKILIILFASFFLHAETCNTRLLTTIQETQERVKILLEKKNSSTQLIRKIDGGEDGQDIHFLKGVPLRIRPVSATEMGIVRHYSPAVDEIVATGKLKAGLRPYILPDAHLREEYVDLNGIFFTTREFDPKTLWMGYDHETPYIDFKLPQGTGVLYLADGNYLIPGPASKPKWIEEAYLKWEKTGEAPAYILPELEAIKARGGLEAPLEIEIEIVKVFKP